MESFLAGHYINRERYRPGVVRQSSVLEIVKTLCIRSHCVWQKDSNSLTLLLCEYPIHTNQDDPIFIVVIATCGQVVDTKAELLSATLLGEMRMNRGHLWC